MCIAIMKSAGFLVKDEILENCFENNPHGAGFTSFIPGEGLKTFKGFFKFEDFMEVYKDYKVFKSIIHFRWATVGEQNYANCHPFTIEDKFSVVHNGTIKINPDYGMSDSATFVKRYIKPIVEYDYDAFNKPDIMKCMSVFAEDVNKLIILRDDGSHWIINESAGQWIKGKEGVWFSNTGFVSSRTHYSSSYNYGKSYGSGSGSGGYYGSSATSAKKKDGAISSGYVEEAGGRFVKVVK